jgi:tetratricopeptide (TPR) repeat protein
LAVDESFRTIDVGVSALEKAIALDPDYFDSLVYMNLTYREKSLVLSSVGKTDEAAEAFEKAEEYKKIAEGLGKKRMAAAAAK